MTEPDKAGGHPLPARSYTEVGDILNNLCALFGAARQRRSLTIRQVAAELVVSSSTVSRLESGQTPSVEVAVKVLEWLELDCSACLADAHGTTEPPATFVPADQAFPEEKP